MTVFCGYCGAPMGQPHWDCCPLHDKEEVVHSLAGDVNTASILTRHKRVINNTQEVRSHSGECSHIRAQDDGPIPWEDTQ